MKKLFACIRALVMLLSMGFSSMAELPAFLKTEMNNYSASYRYTLSLGDTADILALLDEMEFLEEIETFVDVKSMLTSIFKSTETVEIQADISENYDKMQLAMVSETDASIAFNPNLTLAAKAKAGIWMDMDISAKDPVFQIIMASPVTNKYLVIDLMEIMAMEAEEEQKMVQAMMKSFMNKDFVQAVQEKSAEIFEQYADIKVRGSKVSVSIDNDALIAIINQAMQMNEELYAPLMMAQTGAFEEEMPLFPNIQILGKDGIKVDYTLSRGKISTMSMAMDLHLNFSGFAALLGEEWPFAHQGILDIGMKMDGKVSKIGTTRVSMPQITADNAVFVAEKLAELYDNEPEPVEEEPAYPNFYADGWASYLPVVDGKVYVPLRDTLTSAYGDTVTFGFENGKITVACEYFTDFKTLSFMAGDATIYADDMAATIDPVILENGTTYISTDAVEGIFGWELSDLTHDLLYGEYYYAFWTE